MIVASVANSALAAKVAAKTIPVIFVSGVDPISSGLVASLNHPGGNLTGVTELTEELGPKHLELLHEAASNATIVDEQTSLIKTSNLV